MRRFHRSTLAGALVAGGLALFFVGPVAVAVVMLRCCDDSTGPTAGAWLVMALLLLAAVGTASALGGLLAAALRRGWKSRRPRR